MRRESAYIHEVLASHLGTEDSPPRNVVRGDFSNGETFLFAPIASTTSRHNAPQPQTANGTPKTERKYYVRHFNERTTINQSRRNKSGKRPKLHRPSHRGRQTALLPQCPPPRTHWPNRRPAIRRPHRLPAPLQRASRSIPPEKSKGGSANPSRSRPFLPTESHHRHRNQHPDSCHNRPLQQLR